MKGLYVLPLLFSITLSFGQGPQGYYRSPTLHGDNIIFAAEGDLWVVHAKGGLARRLTTHQGEETYPRVSPDGKTLAFSATEGPTELYIMPVTGGLPSRLTYEQSASIAVGWTRGGRILYTTSEYSTLPDLQLVIVNPESGSRVRVPLSQASEASYDDSGKTLYFVRPAFHRNNTKRYQGGTARNIWKFSEDAEAQNLTADFAGENHSPMWWNDRVYYVCDRDGTMNIWSMNGRGADLKQHTRHSGWDVKSPSLWNGKIVYQLGADIYLLNTRNDKTALVPISLASDFDQLREKWVRNPMEYLTSAHIHPEGDSVVLTSRGRVFVAPVKKGRFVRASGKAGVRYRDTVFMPDGATLLALSDESGEFEFEKLPATGIGEAQALTGDGQMLRYQGHPSPDGKWVAYSDMNQDLWLLEVETGVQKKLSDNREGIAQISWSPDSRWLTYARAAENSYLQILLYSLREETSIELTSDRVNSVSPAWSPKGDFLYFLSDRNLISAVGSPWGHRQPEPYFDKPVKVYEIALKQGLRSLFKPEDELAPKKEDDSKKDEDTVNVEIDIDGIATRLSEVPVPAGSYRNLAVKSGALFWISRDSGSRAQSHLMGVAIGNEGKKPVKIVEDIRSFELSVNGKKLLIRKGNAFHVIDAAAKAASKLADSKVDLANWSFPIDVRADFRQLFVDAWRMERDYFYDPAMHGLNWNAIRDKYLPLVDRVTTRMELSDLIGEVVGELSALHVSVRGGDHRRGPDRVPVAALGARLERDDAAGGFRIDYIYQADPDYPDELSPLAEAGLDVGTGDIILAINGTSALSVIDLRALLRNQQDKPVRLKIRTADGSSTRDVIVTPTGQEGSLRYRDWEYTRRLKVDELSNDRIGYVHLRAMGGRNITEWYRHFYPVFNREGLIIDVRHNRGGNIDSLILEKLIRKAWFYWKSRVGEPTWNMQYAFRGHMVVLCNEMTASDGEAFAEGFRRLGLGKVIGTRTWGGEIWLSSNNRLTDMGLARAPQTGVYGPEREWLIEGHGVDPDIVVDNLPHATFNGEDAQLQAAIDFLLEEIQRHPVDVPEPPPHPDKSFAYPPERQ